MRLRRPRGTSPQWTRPRPQRGEGAGPTVVNHWDGCGVCGCRLGHGERGRRVCAGRHHGRAHTMAIEVLGSVDGAARLGHGERGRRVCAGRHHGRAHTMAIEVLGSVDGATLLRKWSHGTVVGQVAVDEAYGWQGEAGAAAANEARDGPGKTLLPGCGHTDGCGGCHLRTRQPREGASKGCHCR